MADDLLSKDLLAYDPLNEITRKERTALLGLSVLGVALVKVPLIPEKFALLGIDFAKVQQEKFVNLFALIVAYYLAAFAIYAFTDYVAWRRQEVITHKEYEHLMNERRGTKPLIMRQKSPTTASEALAVMKLLDSEPAYRGAASYWLGFSASRIRATFEFLFPVVFGIYSITALTAYA